MINRLAVAFNTGKSAMLRATILYLYFRSGVYNERKYHYNPESIPWTECESMSDALYHEATALQYAYFQMVQEG